jgi:exonuclease III
MAKQVITWEAQGTRIVWVRLRGADYNTIFVSVYVPHKYRACPSQAEMLQELETLCRMLQHKFPTDQLIVAGDMNAKLTRNVQNLTGRYCMHYYSDSGGERLMELMAHTNLVAASTRFAPSKKNPLGQGTYINDKYTGKPTQIDYILCDNKHMSNFKSCRVRWDLSMNVHGNKRDHGLIHMTTDAVEDPSPQAQGGKLSQPESTGVTRSAGGVRPEDRGRTRQDASHED